METESDRVKRSGVIREELDTMRGCIFICHSYLLTSSCTYSCSHSFIHALFCFITLTHSLLRPPVLSLKSTHTYAQPLSHISFFSCFPTLYIVSFSSVCCSIYKALCSLILARYWTSSHPERDNKSLG